MADTDGVKTAKKDFQVDVPPRQQAFHVKGMDNTDWGMKDRLSRVFCPKSGKTVMLAFDHGYFLGAVTGLERVDLTIVPLADYADVLMGTDRDCAAWIRANRDPNAAAGQGGRREGRRRRAVG